MLQEILLKSLSGPSVKWCIPFKWALKAQETNTHKRWFFMWTFEKKLSSFIFMSWKKMKGFWEVLNQKVLLGFQKYINSVDLMQPDYKEREAWIIYDFFLSLVSVNTSAFPPLKKSGRHTTKLFFCKFYIIILQTELTWNSTW